jgi:hypothetical protein
MLTKQNRAITAAAAASIALTAFGLSPAAAAPPATEVGYRNDGGAAALGAFAAIAGTIAIIAASHHDRGPAYEGPYGYGYAPAPYAYAPRYGSDGGGWHGWRGHWHGR